MRIHSIILGVLAAALTIGGCAQEKEAPPPSAAPETARTIAQGSLVGFVEENGAHVWRGVPFAASTAGPNRWRAPRPAPSWSGERAMLSFAERCPQLTNGFNPVEGVEPGALVGSEDCLALDIYAPPNAESRALPVMVWIHGGSNVSGGADLYPAHRLAKNEDVIVVVVQYRLGPLGWFAYGALRESAQTPRDKSANFGTLDLIASLEWVRDNIAVFGGDPGNVTIFGESAGGHNVVSLLATPLASDLFHRAIIQSGSFASVSLSDAEGATGDEIGAGSVIAAKLGGSVEALQSARVKDVFDAYPLQGGFIELPRIIEDGVVLPSAPMRDAFASTGRFNAVPIITGVNRDEMKLFYLLDDRLTKRVLGAFFVARDQALYDAAAEYSSRMWRVRSVDEPARAMADAGHEAVYAYRFDWDEGGRFFLMDLAKMLGAAHAVEIPFVLNRFSLLGDADRVLFTKKTEASRQQLSRAMGAYWAAFARDGAPNASGAPDWPHYGADARLLRLDTESDGGIEVIEGEDTVEAIIADLKGDARVTAEERCEIADGLAGWAPERRDEINSALCS
ncbi:MAG: carboxylesterase family protein [Pseudomonadota bacterium]